MRKVEFSYLPSPQCGRVALTRYPRMDMLHAVCEQGSISGASRSPDLSCRHVWGPQKGWDQGQRVRHSRWEPGAGHR